MKLTQQGGFRAEQMGQNAIGFLSLEHINNKYVVVLRPNEYRKHDSSFMRVFRSLKEQTDSVTNGNIMPLESFVEDKRGGYYIVGHTRYIPLGQLLADQPAIIADTAWVRRFVTDLFEALDHLHKRGLAAVELTPLSVLVSKSKEHKLMLMPPASGFLEMRHEVWARENEFLAPELFGTDDIKPNSEGGADVASLDVYAAAQILKRLFKFSELPSEFQSFVTKASNTDASLRPCSMFDAERMVVRARTNRGVLKTLFAFLLGVVIIGLFIWGADEPEAPEFQSLPVNTFDSLNVSFNESDVQTSLEDEVEAMLADSNYLKKDTIQILSEERRAEEKERTNKQVAAFRSRFTTLARATLSSVYTREKLTGSEALFRQEVTIAMARLQEQADKLADQYKLNYTLAQAEAAQVINKVTDELKRKAMDTQE